MKPLLGMTTVSVILCLLLVFPTFIASGSPVNAQPQPAATCTKYPGNPVLSAGPPGSWDQAGVSSQYVMSNGTRFNMWYTGRNSTTGSWNAIGYATSSDGINWAKYPAPVLFLGGSGAMDSLEIYTRSVIWNGSYYLMYYTEVGILTATSLGVALSKDMIHWQKYQGNPILTPGPSAYDNVSVKLASVIYSPSLYQMWYVGRYVGNYSYSIGYATSTDGLHWMKYAGNPVITRSTSNNLYRFGPTEPSVVKVGSSYLAAIEYDALITYATSIDGIRWFSTGASLLEGSNASISPEAIVDLPSLVPVGNALYLWYSRIPSNSSTPWTIGFAFCTLNPTFLTTTTTSVLTSTLTAVSTTTVASEKTTIQTSVTTAQSSGSAYAYEISTVVLGSLLAVSLAVLLLSRRRLT